MKTKLLILTAALIGAASLSAQAGVYVSFRFPFPPVPVVRISVPAPAPVVIVAAPVPAPVVVTTSACPGPDYVWASGYWSGYGPARVWVAGGWHPGPHAIVYNTHSYYGHPYGGHRW
jgi:hypothetical protein